MQIRHILSKSMKVSGQTILIDWKTPLKKSEISVPSGHGIIYIGVVGLTEYSDRTVHFKLGKGSTVMAHSIVIGGKTQQLISNIIVEHTQPRSTSRIISRGVFGGASKGTLNGTIHITKNGQQSDARLEERVLLLSTEAKAETIPNLEIEADDVKASHAATVARLSDEEIFYLQTRGFEKNESIALLLDAFITSQLTHLPNGTEHTSLERALMKKLKEII